MPVVSQLQRRRLLAGRKLFRNVVVVPFEHLLSRQAGGHDHKGGPIWPDWERQLSARFNRDRQPHDALPEWAEPERIVNLPDCYWAGPLHPHFGHGIADFYSRLAGTLASCASARLVFASRATQPISTLEEAPHWFRGLMSWYGVPDERIILVTGPTRFQSLSVLPQQEQLEDVGPSDAYLDLLDEIVLRNRSENALAPLPDFDPLRPTYVSRAGMHTRFAGEAYLETVLQLNGWNVFRPEQHGLRRQMSVYCESSRLVFPEGSAIHGTQLLGRNLHDVSVLVRRSGMRFGEPFLRPRSRQLGYVDVTRGMVHGLNNRNRPLLSGGMPLLDEGKLLAWLQQFGLRPGTWSPEEFAEAQNSDLESWLRFTAGQPHSADSREMICQTLAREGFERLSKCARHTLFS